MSSYIINFTVYTMAMLGMIFFAVFVYKKVMNGTIYKNGSKNLSIEERMNINPRKSLLIVKAGDERFLVASDMERTSLISKLNNPEPNVQKNDNVQNNDNVQKNVITQKTENTQNMQKMQNNKEEFSVPKKMEIPIFIPEKQEEVSEVEQPVYFEPIKEKNPLGANLRRGMDRREPYKSHIQVTNVVPQYSNRVKKSSSTMKEMAARINKL